MSQSKIAAIIGSTTGMEAIATKEPKKIGYTVCQSNGKPHDGSCTSLQGYIDIPYARIASKLGYPAYVNQDKKLAEWIIKGEDGTIATIYDWKNYGGKKEKIFLWHIGGKDQKAVKLIGEIFPEYSVRKA